MNAAAARDAMDQVTETWGARYPAVIRLWDSAWEQFIPFLDYDVEIRKVLCSTNAIESLNARYRRAIKARGHFPTEQAGRIQPVSATPGGFSDSEVADPEPRPGFASRVAYEACCSVGRRRS